uniref:Uncharacterized protein n=1 Tax=Anopheles stephensi TaxID=30069 RepID=A0A182Y1H8_ANOST
MYSCGRNSFVVVLRLRKICILFAIAIAVAIYYGVIHVDENASDTIKETGSKIKHSIKDGLKKLGED